MMLTDEEIIEIIAKRCEEECGWSKASMVLNHYGWVDVVTHLLCEKGLRAALLEAYKGEIASAEEFQKNARSQRLSDSETYREWQADVATRGGS